MVMTEDNVRADAQHLWMDDDRNFLGFSSNFYDLYLYYVWALLEWLTYTCRYQNIRIVWWRLFKKYVKYRVKISKKYKKCETKYQISESETLFLKFPFKILTSSSKSNKYRQVLFFQVLVNPSKNLYEKERELSSVLMCFVICITMLHEASRCIGLASYRYS